MKILHIIGSMDPKSGGPCQGIRNMDMEMTKHGVWREVVSLDEPKASFIKNDPFAIHALGRGKGPWQYNRKLRQWLYWHIGDFDIAIVNGMWLYTGYITRKLVQQRKKEGKAVPLFFVMPHGMLDPYFQRARSRWLKALRNFFYWYLVEQHLIAQADGVLFTCEMELLLARQTFKRYTPKREINIGYGITAPPAFGEALQQAFEDKCPGVGYGKYLLFLSRIDEKKGVDLLVNAYAGLLKESKEPNAVPSLVIAGPGLESSYGRQIAKRVQADALLSKKIYFPGMLSGAAKWGAFYGCEAFILPSHQENFGIAIVEALSCGKPVLITNKVNIYPEIAAGKAGLVADDTAAGIKKLLWQWMGFLKAEKTAYGEAAMHVFQQHFEVGGAVQKIIALKALSELQPQ